MSDCRKCAKFEECAVDEDCGLFVDKPMTNADRIRAMTDEELADWIELLLCPENCPDEQMGEACARTSCDGCWLSWLKSPVEVDNG